MSERAILRNRRKEMKRRCYNPNFKFYPYYGGRGITVCQEWLDSLDAFVSWALDNGFQEELTLDRIDSNGPYSPDNCRWVTREEQTRNMRNNVTDFEKGTRICKVCGIEKPFEEFHRDKGNPGGRQYTCKSCRSEVRKNNGKLVTNSKRTGTDK